MGKFRLDVCGKRSVMRNSIALSFEVFSGVTDHPLARLAQKREMTVGVLEVEGDQSTCAMRSSIRTTELVAELILDPQKHMD